MQQRLVPCLSDMCIRNVSPLRKFTHSDLHFHFHPTTHSIRTYHPHLPTTPVQGTEAEAARTKILAETKDDVKEILEPVLAPDIVQTPGLQLDPS